MFMCLTHWRMIPRAMQRELWAAYVPGQEVRKDPTAEYLLVARRLINYVARKEHPNCTNCANPNHCCMEHRIHVDRGKPHVSCILR